MRTTSMCSGSPAWPRPTRLLLNKMSRVAANRLLDVAAPIRPNPSYAVGRPVRLEEE
jgi:hypothetical protein